MSRGYVPTPAEILAECIVIQSGWTAAERLRRGTHKLTAYSPAPSTVLLDDIDAVVERDARSGRAKRVAIFLPCVVRVS